MTVYTGTPALPLLLAGQIPDAANDWAGILAALHGISDGWSTWSPVWSSTGTAVALGNGTIAGDYTQCGKFVAARIALNIGSTTTFGTGDYRWTMPVAFSSGGTNCLIGAAVLLDTSAGTTGWRPAVPRNAGSNLLSLTSHSGMVGPTTPFTLASGDDIQIGFVYRTS